MSGDYGSRNVCFPIEQSRRRQYMSLFTKIKRSYIASHLTVKRFISVVSVLKEKSDAIALAA